MKYLKILVSLALIFGVLTGCSSGNESADTEVLNVYNWGVYMELGEEGAENVNALFEDWYYKTYNKKITVNYTEFETNEAMYQKLVAGGAEYDVIIPSDYMISRLIQEDRLEKLNFANIPNYNANISDDFKGDAWQYDPTHEYSVPYMWGYLVLVYNTEYVKGAVNTWDVLWDETYKDKILMFNNPRDTFAVALAKNGFSLNTTDPAHWETAYQDLLAQKPLVQAYVTDEIFDKMSTGEAYLAPCYYGDFLVMQEDAAEAGIDLQCGFITSQISNKYVDAMCIPKGCQNKTAAEAYINFMCSYEAGVLNANYTGYSSPLKDILTQENYDYANEPNLYPAEHRIKAYEEYQYLGTSTQALMDNYWKELKKSDGSIWLYIALAVVVLLAMGVLIYRKLKQKKRERLRKKAREKYKKKTPKEE